MRIETKNEQVISSEQSAGKKFQIAANAKAFEVLTSTMYKNVKASIVRELISNGHDGHVRKGNVDEGFYVHIPTWDEPEFKVRDYGCSMDEDTMMNVYTTFFSSTKNDNNEEIGGFGLGCKVPLAYTDQFTVTTFLNGVKTDYIVCKEDGTPALHKVNSEPTTERDGTLVTVPVTDSDVDTFKKYVTDMQKYSAFNFTTNMQEQEQPFEEYDNCGFPWYHNIKGNTALYVRVGGVPYKVDDDDLSNVEQYKRWDSIFSLEEIKKALENSKIKNVMLDCSFYNLANTPCFIDMDIGEVDVTASREALQFTERTKTAVLKKLAIAMNAAGEKLNELWKSKYGKTFDTLLEVKEFIMKLQHYRINTRMAGALDSYLNFETVLGKHSVYWNRDEDIRVNLFNDSSFNDFKKKCLDLSAKLHYSSSYYDRKESAKHYRWSHKDSNISMTIGVDKVQNIYLTNAPLKHCGIPFLEEDGSNTVVITVDKEVNVEEQGTNLQKKFDSFADGMFNVIVVDRKNIKIPRVKAAKKDKVLNEDGEFVEDKPMVTLAKQIIERFKPMIEEYGCIYMYEKEIFYTEDKTLRALSDVHDKLGIPDPAVIFECMSAHKTARNLVKKLATCPVIILDENERRGVEDNPYFLRILKKVQLIKVADSINNQILSFARDNIESLNRLLQYRTNYLNSIHVPGINDDVVDNSLKKIVEHFLDSLGYTAWEYISMSVLRYGVSNWEFKYFLKDWVQKHKPDWNFR